MSLRDVIRIAGRYKWHRNRRKGIIFECETTGEDCFECACSSCAEWREEIAERNRKESLERQARRDEYSDRVISELNRRKS